MAKSEYTADSFAVALGNSLHICSQKGPGDGGGGSGGPLEFVDTYVAHTSRINVASWNRNNKVVATGCADGRIHLMYANGSVMCVIPRDNRQVPTWGSISALSWSGGSKRLAAGSSDGKVSLFYMHQNMGNVPPVELGGHVGGVTAVEYQQEDKFLAAASASGGVVLYSDPNKAGGAAAQPLQAAADTSARLCLSLGGSEPVMAAGSARGGVAVWDVLQRQVLEEYGEQHSVTAVNGVAFVPFRNSLLYSAGADGRVCLQDRRVRGGPVSTISMGAPATAMTLREDHSLLGVGTAEGVVQLYDPRRLRHPLHTMRMPERQPITALDWQHRYSTTTSSRHHHRSTAAGSSRGGAATAAGSGAGAGPSCLGAVPPAVPPATTGGATAPTPATAAVPAAPAPAAAAAPSASLRPPPSIGSHISTAHAAPSSAAAPSSQASAATGVLARAGFSAQAARAGSISAAASSMPTSAPGSRATSPAASPHAAPVPSPLPHPSTGKSPEAPPLSATPTPSGSSGGGGMAAISPLHAAASVPASVPLAITPLPGMAAGYGSTNSSAARAAPVPKATPGEQWQRQPLVITPLAGGSQVGGSRPSTARHQPPQQPQSQQKHHQSHHYSQQQQQLPSPFEQVVAAAPPAQLDITPLVPPPAARQPPGVPAAAAAINAAAVGSMPRPTPLDISPLGGSYSADAVPAQQLLISPLPGMRQTAAPAVIAASLASSPHRDQHHPHAYSPRSQRSHQHQQQQQQQRSVLGERPPNNTPGNDGDASPGRGMLPSLASPLPAASQAAQELPLQAFPSFVENMPHQQPGAWQPSTQQAQACAGSLGVDQGKVKAACTAAANLSPAGSGSVAHWSIGAVPGTAEVQTAAAAAAQPMQDGFAAAQRSFEQLCGGSGAGAPMPPALPAALEGGGVPGGADAGAAGAAVGAGGLRDDILALHLDMLTQFQEQQASTSQLVGQLLEQNQALNGEVAALRKQLAAITNRRDAFLWL